MSKNKNIPVTRYGDEAPTLKHFLVVMLVTIVLMALAKIAYIEFHI